MTTISFSFRAASSVAPSDELALGPSESSRLFDDSPHAVRAGAPQPGGGDVMAHRLDARTDFAWNGGAPASEDGVVITSAMDPAKTTKKTKDTKDAQDSDEVIEAAEKVEDDLDDTREEDELQDAVETLKWLADGQP